MKSPVKNPSPRLPRRGDYGFPPRTTAPRALVGAAPVIVCLLTLSLTACGSKQTKDKDFFTSGSRPADQRAEQRMAQHQQLKGEKDNSSKAPAKQSLYDRLGGQQGLTAIVDDFITRALNDPRVNWSRTNVNTSGPFGMDKKPVTSWHPTPQTLATLKTHMIEFLSLATGGPSKYTGKEMHYAHAGMRISNPEFDAAVGDMKATLDKLQVPTDDQKELLAIIESTRPQIVEVR
ncbi:MAG: group I truncated hemoglobin [Phycisphaerae bacterium]